MIGNRMCNNQYELLESMKSLEAFGIFMYYIFYIE